MSRIKEIAIGQTKIRTFRWQKRRWSFFTGFFTAILFIVLLGPVAYAATYYVSKTGNNKNPGTQAQPWLTIDFAVDNVAPGDTIYVRNGRYNERITIGVSGTVGKYITLQAFPGESPIIDGTGVSTGQDGLIQCSNVSYYRIIGFKITKYEGTGIRCRDHTSNQRHIEIRNNEIYDNQWTANTRNAIVVHADWPKQGAVEITDVIIDGNYIHDVTTTVCCGTRGNEAITVAAHVERFQITNNIIDTVNNIGIDMIGTDVNGGLRYPRKGRVANNIVRRVGKGTSNTGIYVDGAMEIVIENNLVSNGTGHGITVNAEASNPCTDKIIVRRNQSWDNFRNFSPGQTRSIATWSIDRVRLAHNTAVQNGSSKINYSWYRTYNLGFKNNISYNAASASPARHIENQSTFPVTAAGGVAYNLYNKDIGVGGFQFRGTFYSSFTNWRAGTGFDANSVFGDPMFSDTAGADFRLQGRSPAIDAGVCLTQVRGSGSNKTVVTVDDSLWFHDGYGIEGLQGDLIQIGANNPVRIIGVDYTTNQITLATPISWTDKDCASYPYSGSAPDIGAHEYVSSAKPLPSPTNLRVSPP
jgi:parallel beta-helix repeat protein